MTRVSLLSQPLTEIIGTSIAVLILWIGAREVLSGGGAAMDGATLITFMILVMRLLPPLKQLSQTPTTAQQSLAAAEHHMSAKVVGTAGAALAFWDGEMDRTEHPVCSLKLVREGRLEDMPIAASGELFELRAELRHFAAVIRGETAPTITTEEAALAVALCEAAERSIQSGAVETI